MIIESRGPGPLAGPARLLGRDASDGPLSHLRLGVSGGRRHGLNLKLAPRWSSLSPGRVGAAQAGAPSFTEAGPGCHGASATTWHSPVARP